VPSVRPVAVREGVPGTSWGSVRAYKKVALRPEAIILATLEKDSDQRPQSATEVPSLDQLFSAGRSSAFGIRLLAPLLALLVVSSARAQAPPPASVEADIRSRRGSRLLEEGDAAAALVEWKRAYELVPSRWILYNIALAYAALGRPVEATDTLDRMLVTPGPLPPELLIQARSKREQQAQRIAQLNVNTNVPATIDVGGTPVGRTPLQAPLRLASGTHLVGAVAAGYLPARREVTIGGTLQELNLDLAPAEDALAQVVVRSNVPAADVFVDGSRVGKTPLPSALVLPPGEHILELRRRGYSNVRRQLSLASAARSSVAIEMYEDPAIPPAETGSLAVAVSEDDAVLLVDGQPRTIYRGGGRLPGTFTAAIDGLPWGTHTLRIERPGFQPVERSVEVLAGGTSLVRVTLRPTTESYLAYIKRTRSARNWAVSAVTAGTVLTLGSGALAVSRHIALQDAQRRLDDERRDQENMSGGSCDPSLGLSPAALGDCAARLQQAETAVTDRQRLRLIGLVGTGAGLLVTAVGVYLLSSGEDPRRYDALALPWIASNGAGLSLSLSF
jgi:tetratricopeptide (TPR) repeat protein